MIDPEFWKDDKLAELEITTRLIFISTWNYADDQGYYEENYKKMRAVLFPYDLKLDIKKHIEKLISAGFIEVYQNDGTRYHHIKNFLKYQTINRPTTSIIRKLLENSNPLTEDSLNTHAEEKLREVKLSKVKLSKDKYGENVFLSALEYEKLKTKYGEENTKAFIEKLDNSIASKGYKYQDHYRTILNWVVDAVLKPMANTKTSNQHTYKGDKYDKL